MPGAELTWIQNLAKNRKLQEENLAKAGSAASKSGKRSKKSSKASRESEHAQVKETGVQEDHEMKDGDSLIQQLE